jgi:hypothetical protein
MNNFRRKIPILNLLVDKFHALFLSKFPGSGSYWERRYLRGGNSGTGSYGAQAKFKAKIINAFVAAHDINSVIEFGCGDGNQLGLANYPHYVGYDVSETAISLCQELFSSDLTKEFRLMKNYAGEMADLVLSLDVIYHLVEDRVFEDYMSILFNAAQNYTIVYSSNTDSRRWYQKPHVKHRKFTVWVLTNMPQWRQIEFHKGLYADFYIFEKNEDPLGS